MNKHILSLLCMVASIFGVCAQQFNGQGYYRIQNNYTERYCYLLDNWVKVDQSATKVTLSSIELWKKLERAQSDPSTVLYIKQVGSKYDIEAQGASLYQLAGVYLSLYYDESRKSYLAYGTYSGLTKYLTDNTPSLSAEQAWMCDTRTGEYSYWRLQPISSESDNFFGIKPTLTAGGKHYASMYCGFPFEAAPGMTLYYVSSIDAKRGLAIYKAINGGKVAAATPMFIECASTEVASNKVNVGVPGNTVSGNKLTGVYFNINNYFHPHVNQTKYDPNTMRLLGLTAEGKLGYVTSTEQYVPRNTAYLSVPANSPADFRLVTQEEYDDIIAHEVVEAAEVALSQTSLSLSIGEEATLTATVLPDNTTDKSVAWTSSDARVATVDGGVVKAVGAGSASITATCGAAKAVCQVTVNKHSQQIVWEQSFEEMVVGSELELTAKATSGLPVAYSLISGGSLATLTGNKLHFEGAGTVQVQASQEGSDWYQAAVPVAKSITVIASGIEDIELDDAAVVEVYTPMGVLVYKGAKAGMGPLRGLYIMRAAGRAWKLRF